MITFVCPVMSANKYWRPVRIGQHITIVPTKEAKQYRLLVKMIAEKAGASCWTHRLNLRIDLFPHCPQDAGKRIKQLGPLWADSVRCIDLGNVEKVLSDALNGVVWADDRQVWDTHMVKHDPDQHGLRAVVTISEWVNL